MARPLPLARFGRRPDRRTSKVCQDLARLGSRSQRRLQHALPGYSDGGVPRARPHLPAEDSLQSARARVDGISRHRGLDLRRADLHLITSPSLRLDQEFDKERLAATVAAIRPRLLLLDPFVRLHRSDENDSGAISAILADLRTLQRTFDVAVLLVHHSRKNGRGPQGYALRGSGDLYAWGDAYAYLSRRTAPSSSPSSIDLDPPSTPSLSGSCRAPMAPPLTSRSTVTNAKVQPPPLSPSREGTHRGWNSPHPNPTQGPTQGQQPAPGSRARCSRAHRPRKQDSPRPFRTP